MSVLDPYCGEFSPDEKYEILYQQRGFLATSRTAKSPIKSRASALF
jgi:hypothetical protein